MDIHFFPAHAVALNVITAFQLPIFVANETSNGIISISQEMPSANGKWSYIVTTRQPCQLQKELTKILEEWRADSIAETQFSEAVN